MCSSRPPCKRTSCFMAPRNKLRRRKVSLDRIDRRLLADDVWPAMTDVPGSRRACILRDDQPAERTPERRLNVVVATRYCDRQGAESGLRLVVEPVIHKQLSLVVDLHTNETLIAASLAL